MYESNVRETFALEGGGTVTEKLFGFELVPDNLTVTQDVLAMGFDCGAPPEPAVSPLLDRVWTVLWSVLYGVVGKCTSMIDPSGPCVQA